MGPDIARFAEPLKLSEGPSGGTLTLRAEPAAAVFMQHQTRALCERINAFLGRPAVARLRFVDGADRATPPPEPPPRPPGDPPRAAGPTIPPPSFDGPETAESRLLILLAPGASAATPPD